MSNAAGSVGGAANPAISVAAATDPAAVSPQTAQARLALLDSFVYEMPTTDAGLVQDSQWTEYTFPQGNYGYGNGLNQRLSCRMDFSGRAPVVREMMFTFTLRTLYPPGGNATVPSSQSYYAMRYSLVDSCMQPDEHLHDLFSQIILVHPSGSEIYREREVALVSRLLRIANAPNPPVRWAMYPQPMIGGWAGLGAFKESYDTAEKASGISIQHRQPSAMRLTRMPVDPLGEEVYDGFNINAWVDGMRSLFFSAYQPLPGPAGQEASSSLRGREFSIRLPARCFDGAPIWPTTLPGLTVNIELAPPGQAFKPTPPRLCHELGGVPDDFVFQGAFAMPSTTGTEWGYQINNPRLQLRTLRLSASMNDAMSQAAETSGLPISWTQVTDAIAPVPAGATSLLVQVPVQVSNLVGVMVATYSQAMRQDWRRRLYLMNVWNHFSARLGTATIPPGNPFTGPAMARQLLRAWFPLPRGAKGYITPVDWEGSQELVIRVNYMNSTTATKVLGTISRYNPKNFFWSMDFRTTPGVPLSGVSTLASQLTLVFGRTSANIPTTLAWQFGASASTADTAATIGTIGNINYLPGVAAFPFATNNRAILGDLFSTTHGRPYIINPRGYEAVQSLNNCCDDFVYPIAQGDTTATAALNNWQLEPGRLGYTLAAGTGIDDAANRVQVTLATGALTLYPSGAAPYAFMCAHPGPSTDLVNQIFAFYTKLCFFGPAGITTRE